MESLEVRIRQSLVDNGIVDNSTDISNAVDLVCVETTAFVREFKQEVLADGDASWIDSRTFNYTLERLTKGIRN